MRWDAFPQGNRLHLQQDARGVSCNEPYRSLCESRVESRPPCDVVAIEFGGMGSFNMEFCVCRLLATEYLPRITPCEMQHSKDSISVYSGICGIAHTHSSRVLIQFSLEKPW